MTTVIKVENLWKEYTLGGIGHRLLYRDVQTWFAKALGKEDPNALIAPDGQIISNRDDKFWALQNISFEVKDGEVLGVIGRNGAGKSTLLKILSRITSPSQGQIKIKGRISSLLEVGTGFHPELTGRENIFLNGTILGMRHKEIERKLDEIIDFAEIEKFIDTPVKRYSSGMYVRLAFAVAAHLEPEILIVDEVLAVGDIDFQNKCLGKMREVSRSGRTVLFVSHNMGSIQQLCTKAILLSKGQIIESGSASAVVSSYLLKQSGENGERLWERGKEPSFQDNSIKLKAIRTMDSSRECKRVFNIQDSIRVEVEYEIVNQKHFPNVHLYFRGRDGQNIFVSMDNSVTKDFPPEPFAVGRYKASCTIPPNFLNEGTIRVEYLICTKPTGNFNIAFPDAISFEVTDNRDNGGVRADWSRDWPDALIRPRLDWTLEKA